MSSLINKNIYSSIQLLYYFYINFHILIITYYTLTFVSIQQYYMSFTLIHHTHLLFSLSPRTKALAVRQQAFLFLELALVDLTLGKPLFKNVQGGIGAVVRDPVMPHAPHASHESKGQKHERNHNKRPKNHAVRRPVIPWFHCFSPLRF